MGINASTAGNNKKPTPLMEPGGYPARLVQVIDLGLQPQRPFKGEEKPPIQMIMTTYEFSDEFMKDEDGQDIPDKPRWLSEDLKLYNIKADKAESTARYKVLDPTFKFGGDWAALLGMPCSVTVVVNPNRKDKTHPGYNNIGGTAVMRDKDAAKLPKLVNSPVVFDLDNPDIGIFMSLPKFVQDKVKANLNFNGSKLQELLGEANVDNTPAKNEHGVGDYRDPAGSEDTDEEAPY